MDERGIEAASRWLGILTTGLLLGADDEVSAQLLAKAIGGPQLGELRRWFASADPAATREAKIAVLEGCIAVARADRSVVDAEREALDRVLDGSELDDAARAQLRKALDEGVPLDTIAGRLGHPALRDALLVLAWQMARVDGRVVDDEAGVYGVLADKLGISPARASELRAILQTKA